MAIPNELFGEAGGVSAPLRDGYDITPGPDSFAVTRSIYVGVGGDLEVTFESGATVILFGVQSGWHPIRVSHVLSTNTTAQNIVGCR